MDPILKDTIRLQIHTGDSIKKILQNALFQLNEVVEQIREDNPSFEGSDLYQEAGSALDDLSGGIDALEYLCDGMKDTFDIIPDGQECTDTSE